MREGVTPSTPCSPAGVSALPLPTYRPRPPDKHTNDMAKTSIHIRPANLGKGGGGSNSEGHMFREKWYLEAVEKYPDAAGHFELIEGAEANGYWKNKNYLGGALALLERDKREAASHSKSGKAPSMKERTRTNPKTGRTYTVAGWSPIREAVVVVKPETRMKDLQGLADWFHSKGIVVIAAAIHRDEGHTDLETGEVKINYHAHLLLDYMDHKTGKTVKLSDLDMQQMQTEAAKSLGMERGESKEKTSRRGLAADEYRAKAKADELARLEAKVKAARLDAEQAQQEAADLRRQAVAGLGAKAAALFGAGDLAKSRKRAEEAEAEAKEAKERATYAEKRAAQAGREARQAIAAKEAAEKRAADAEAKATQARKEGREKGITEAASVLHPADAREMLERMRKNGHDVPLRLWTQYDCGRGQGQGQHKGPSR